MQNTVIRKRDIYFFIYILYIYIYIYIYFFSFTNVLINSAQSPPSSQFRGTVNRETTSNPTHFTSILRGSHISLAYHVAQNFCSKKNQSVQENMGSDKVKQYTLYLESHGVDTNCGFHFKIFLCGVGRLCLESLLMVTGNKSFGLPKYLLRVNSPERVFRRQI